MAIDFNSKLGRKAKRLIRQSHVAWLTTLDSKLMPQPRPVWFIWDRDAFLIFSQAEAHKVRQVREHPRVSLHFNTDETGDRDVIVFLGRAALDPGAPPAYRVPTYFKKYRSGIKALDLTPEEFSRTYSVAIRITPTALRGW